MQLTGRGAGTIAGAGAKRALAEALREARRAMVGDLFAGVKTALGGGDLTLVQLATLLLLSDEETRSVNEIAERLGRSVSATSRMLDNLVKRRLIKRKGDPEDRRVRLVMIAAGGEKLVSTLMDRRVEAQLSLMELLTAEERAVVARGMILLAEAARKRRSDELGSKE